MNVNLIVLMIAKISGMVQGNMEFTEGIGLPHVIHETHKIHRRPAVSEMRDYFAGGYLPGCQERLGTMPDMLVAPGADFSSSQGEQRLSSVERLNTGFLADAQQQSIFRGFKYNLTMSSNLASKSG